MALATLAAPVLAVAALAAFGAVSDDAEPGLGSLPAPEGLQGSTVAAKPDKATVQHAPVKERRGHRQLASRGAGPPKGTAPTPQPKTRTEPEDPPTAGFTPSGAAPVQPEPATASPPGTPGSVYAPSGTGGSQPSGGSGSGAD